MPAVALRVEKVASNDAGDFKETTEFTVLHCANVDGNNNKFYILEIQKNPTTGNFRLFSNYGRLGVPGVYEIRQQDRNGNTLDESICKTEFAKIIKKKERGKTVKLKNGDSIREHYSKVDVVSPNIGSSNICNVATVNVTSSAPAINTNKYDSETSRLIRTFITENIHSITSSTTMTFTKNGLETPLGPVTENHLDKATSVLNDLRDMMGSDTTLDSNDKNVRITNSEYFSLIPRKFGRQIQSDDMILTPDKMAEEYDLLSNLRTAVQAGLNSNDGSKNTGVDIDIAFMDVNDEWKRLADKYETTKHRNHVVIQGYKVKNIFTIDIPFVTNRYLPVEAKLGNVRELFHGTKTANMLSISINGLIIPPTGAAHVTGRMFGNGVYGASCSTKALNYAVGYWGGRKNKSNAAYMLIVKFAMGREYVANSHLYTGAPNGYNSVWGKAGRALLNDEYIVYNLNQATITHILELENT